MVEKGIQQQQPAGQFSLDHVTLEITYPYTKWIARGQHSALTYSVANSEIFRYTVFPSYTHGLIRIHK